MTTAQGALGGGGGSQHQSGETSRSQSHFRAAGADNYSGVNVQQQQHGREERDTEHIIAATAPWVTTVSADAAATAENIVVLPGRRKKTAAHFPVLSAVRHVEASVLHVASVVVSYC